MAIQVVRREDPTWELPPMRGLRTCCAHVTFAEPSDAFHCLLTLNGRPLHVTRTHVLAGSDAFPKIMRGTHVTALDDNEDQDVPAGYNVEVRRPYAPTRPIGGARGTDIVYAGTQTGLVLATVQLFYAVRDGHIGAATSAIRAGVPVDTPLIAKYFPEVDERLEGCGREWPRRGYDGEARDTALHIAARYLDEGLVRTLIESGADAKVVNGKGKRALECVGRIVKRGWREEKAWREEEVGEGRKERERARREAEES
eukprot:282918-Rhodomonas_salina.1